LLARNYKTKNCSICKREFKPKSPNHIMCSNRCFLHYRRNIRPKQKPASKAQRRKWYLKSRYGLEYGEWDLLFLSQGKRCAICDGKNPGNKQGWCTDHCHETGKVRGILCHNCNTDMGGFDRIMSKLRGRKYAKKNFLW